MLFNISLQNIYLIIITLASGLDICHYRGTNKYQEDMFTLRVKLDVVENVFDTWRYHTTTKFNEFFSNTVGNLGVPQSSFLCFSLSALYTSSAKWAECPHFSKTHSTIFHGWVPESTMKHSEIYK